MGDPVLSVRNVGLSYKSKTGSICALDSVSFDIEKGEFVCVLGPSGCGKSSMLRLIAGFEEATEGTLLLEGKPIKGIDWRRGVVFQKDNLFEWLSVRNNVNYGLRMRGISRCEILERTNAMLKQMGLLDFADKKVYELSGGMRQRVSIGRTLINNPDILLMDEPFSALDALTREQLQDFLRDLWVRTGNTIFFITHDIDEALVMGTRVLVMSKRPGRVMKDLSFDYTRKISDDNNSRRKLSTEYFQDRRMLFEQISMQD